MDNEKSRSQNVLLNTLWTVLCQFAIVVLGLFSRKVFLGQLGAELLGVNSLFSDVLMLFSFADLGFGTAIMFSMYKPIAKNDANKVGSLLLFYRTIYRYVIATLIIISLCFIPFLGTIKTEIPVNELIVYYMFFQFANIAEYVWAYREGYVIACQRERELSVFNLVYNIIRNIAQIAIVLLFSNFILYLVVGAVCVVVKKILVNWYIVKKYPVTTLRGVQKLSKAERKGIMNKSIALLITKVGNLIINQTDSLIVSYFISVVQWGFASNYLVIKKAIFTVSDKIYSSVLPSMGNLLVSNNKEHETKVFLKYDYLNAWMHTFFFVAFVCMSNPFISIFFGKDAVLSYSFVFVFFFAGFIDGLRSPVSVMREAGGSFEKDKWYTIVAAIVNIVVSVPLAMMLGLNGVYIGTICAMFVLHICRTMVLLNGNDYAISTIKYLLVLVRHALIGLLICGITFYLVQLLDKFAINKYLLFVIKGILVCIIPNAIWIALSINNECFRELMDKLKERFKGVKG